MTGVRLELGNPESYSTVQSYIKEHVIPVVTELHRLTNELMAPGATAEEVAVDMVPSKALPNVFHRLDRQLSTASKHVNFDGSSYFKMSAETLRSKQLKVQLSALVYVKGGGSADFRIVREDGMYVENSQFQVVGSQPKPMSRILPFGDFLGGVSPSCKTYYIEASRPDSRCLPVCRRFSMSFVLI